MSSDGYANRLSDYPNKGKCGLPETIESKRIFNLKLQKLIKMMKESNYIVILTGAGISTSAGIPDFRGPNGIWTNEKRDNKKRKEHNASKKNIKSDFVINKSGEPSNRKRRRDEMETKPKSVSTATTAATFATNNATIEPTTSKARIISFETAKPTITHRAITRLTQNNIVKYSVTQNVDGLHRRSGLPRSKHAVLHGCIFTEKCELCQHEYFRDFDVGGLSFQKTGRYCTESQCAGGTLRDTVLDWEDELPEPDWTLSQEECNKSDLCICLGTSLRIEPAGSLPTMAKKFVIVNKQETPYDAEAEFFIRAPVDDVCKQILAGMNLELSDEEEE